VFQVFGGAAQLIEHGAGVRDDDTPLHRGLHAARQAVEQAHTERVLQLGDRFGHGGLRHRKLVRGLRDAPLVRDKQQHAQLAQLQAAHDPVLQIHARLLLAGWAVGYGGLGIWNVWRARPMLRYCQRYREAP
jgi:hypothetical protein